MRQIQNMIRCNRAWPTYAIWKCFLRAKWNTFLTSSLAWVNAPILNHWKIWMFFCTKGRFYTCTFFPFQSLNKSFQLFRCHRITRKHSLSLAQHLYSLQLYSHKCRFSLAYTHTHMRALAIIIWKIMLSTENVCFRVLFNVHRKWTENRKVNKK